MTDAEKIKSLKDALEYATEQFEFYVRQHRAKTPPDENKATVNQNFADMCSAILEQTSL